MVRGYQVDIDGDEIIIPGQGSRRVSDNTWEIGDKAIQKIVDFGSDNNALWIATRRSGVFKVRF